MRTLRDEVVVDRAVPLRNRDGSEQAPVAVKEVASGGHHRQAEVVFPSIEGATQVRDRREGHPRHPGACVRVGSPGYTVRSTAWVRRNVI